MNKLEQANSYVNKNIDKVNGEYRLNYHLMPPVGWMNDPNGFSFFNKEYHLFYQFHPYSSTWGPMHWAHVKSKDLITWEWLPVAIAPDEEFDEAGCFSGSAIEKDGKLYLVYTGCTDQRQMQCVAVSEDGVIFNKLENNPVIKSDMLPANSVEQDFRDPKVFKKGDNFYVVIAAKDKDAGGQILLYKSLDMVNWQYVGILAKSDNKLGVMWECPDLFELDGKDILIMSPMRLKEDGYKYWNINSVTYMLGKIDYSTGKYDYNYMDELDFGFDFYAPQTMEDDKGRRILIAWMQNWGRKMPTNEKKHNWAGAMTLPRELNIVNGKLYQTPISEIGNYRKNEVVYSNIVLDGNKILEGIEGQSLELKLNIDMKDAKTFGIKVLKGDKQEVTMYFDKDKEEFTFDRTLNGELLIGEENIFRGYRKADVALINNQLSLDIFIDRSSVEIFINNGEKTMTSTVFPSKESVGIEFFSEGEVKMTNLCKWDIVR